MSKQHYQLILLCSKCTLRSVYFYACKLIQIVECKNLQQHGLSSMPPAQYGMFLAAKRW
jgi:hypothetical protein